MTVCHYDKFEVYNGDCVVVIDYLTVAQLTQLADFLLGG